jgi:hypothetical protein
VIFKASAKSFSEDGRKENDRLTDFTLDRSSSRHGLHVISLVDGHDIVSIDDGIDSNSLFEDGFLGWMSTIGRLSQLVAFAETSQSKRRDCCQPMRTFLSKKGSTCLVILTFVRG